MSRLTLITGSLLGILLIILTHRSVSSWQARVDLPERAILYLTHRGVIQGFPDGTFRGSSPVSRAEAAKLLILASGIAIEEDLPNPFNDIPPSEWFTPFVLTAKDAGILDGYSDGSFRPVRGVTTAEFIKMAIIAFELPVSLPHRFTDIPVRSWFVPYLGATWHYHLFPSRITLTKLLPEELLSRNDMTVALYQIATFGTKAHFIDKQWDLKQDRIDILKTHGQFRIGGRSLPTPVLTGGILPMSGGLVPAN